jgi:hypothetical protein
MLRLVDHPRLGTILALVIGAVSRATTDIWTYVFMGLALLILIVTTAQWGTRRLRDMGNKRKRHQDKLERRVATPSQPVPRAVPGPPAFSPPRRSGPLLEFIDSVFSHNLTVFKIGKGTNPEIVTRGSQFIENQTVLDVEGEGKGEEPKKPEDKPRDSRS